MDVRCQPANPCIGLCQADNNGRCIGCGRTRQERYRWYQLSEVEQREILIRLDSESLSIIVEPR
ncbi:DUF1289 domain-containing protein [Vibrio orientalis]|uniref:DUF1289 domain-containing protein n=1 Tax=Vibrio orientalis TaxID=28175 RepID=UPI0008FF5A27|nr:DUF1289 domain-containing protein [Vibrio orientalis]